MNIIPPSAVVFGGCNLDITGRSGIPLREGSSHPGTIRFTAGGVGRNVAENLARLGRPVRLITILGTDPWSRFLAETTRSAGVVIDEDLLTGGHPVPCYLAVLDDAGEMRLGVNDMAALELLTPRRIAPFLPVCRKAP